MQRVLVTFLLSWMLAGVAMAAEPNALREPVVPTAAELVGCPSGELQVSFDLPRASRKAQQLLDALPDGPAEGVGEAALQELHP
jgi:hypothetical protein